MGNGKEELLIVSSISICLMEYSWDTHAKHMFVSYLTWTHISVLHLTLTMTEPPPPKRQRKQKKKGEEPMRADDPIFLSGAVTIERVLTMDSSGREKPKDIKVPLVLPKENTKNTSIYVQEDRADQTDFDGGPHEDVYDGEPVRSTGTRKV